MDERVERKKERDAKKRSAARSTSSTRSGENLKSTQPRRIKSTTAAVRATAVKAVFESESIGCLPRDRGGDNDCDDDDDDDDEEEDQEEDDNDHRHLRVDNAPETKAPFGTTFREIHDVDAGVSQTFEALNRVHSDSVPIRSLDESSGGDLAQPPPAVVDSSSSATEEAGVQPPVVRQKREKTSAPWKKFCLKAGGPIKKMLDSSIKHADSGIAFQLFYDPTKREACTVQNVTRPGDCPAAAAFSDIILSVATLLSYRNEHAIVPMNASREEIWRAVVLALANRAEVLPHPPPHHLHFVASEDFHSRAPPTPGSGSGENGTTQETTALDEIQRLQLQEEQRQARVEQYGFRLGEMPLEIVRYPVDLNFDGRGEAEAHGAVVERFVTCLGRDNSTLQCVHNNIDAIEKRKYELTRPLHKSTIQRRLAGVSEEKSRASASTTPSDAASRREKENGASSRPPKPSRRKRRADSRVATTRDDPSAGDEYHGDTDAQAGGQTFSRGDGVHPMDQSAQYAYGTGQMVYANDGGSAYPFLLPGYAPVQGYYAHHGIPRVANQNGPAMMIATTTTTSEGMPPRQRGNLANQGRTTAAGAYAQSQWTGENSAGFNYFSTNSTAACPDCASGVCSARASSSSTTAASYARSRRAPTSGSDGYANHATTTAAGFLPCPSPSYGYAISGEQNSVDETFITGPHAQSLLESLGIDFRSNQLPECPALPDIVSPGLYPPGHPLFVPPALYPYAGAELPSPPQQRWNSGTSTVVPGRHRSTTATTSTTSSSWKTKTSSRDTRAIEPMSPDVVGVTPSSCGDTADANANGEVGSASNAHQFVGTAEHRHPQFGRATCFGLLRRQLPPHAKHEMDRLSKRGPPPCDGRPEEFNRSLKRSLASWPFSQSHSS